MLPTLFSGRIHWPISETTHSLVCGHDLGGFCVLSGFVVDNRQSRHVHDRSKRDTSTTRRRRRTTRHGLVVAVGWSLVGFCGGSLVGLWLGGIGSQLWSHPHQRLANRQRRFGSATHVGRYRESSMTPRRRMVIQPKVKSTFQRQSAGNNNGRESLWGSFPLCFACAVVGASGV